MISWMVGEQLRTIHEQIEQACQAAGRTKEDVKLLLAVKTVSIDKVEAAIQAGEVLLGENKVQELKEKYPLLQQHELEWHFIGHLQTNKVKDVIRYVTMIHSVDRLKLAHVLHDYLVKANRTMDILIQVNTSYEASKFGVSPEEALDLVRQISELSTLRIKGLMTIGKLHADEKETRQCFQRLKQLQRQIREHQVPGVEMDVLSMGMSGDFAIAIEEGATLIRVGTRIFGERPLPDHYYWNEGQR